MAHDTYQSPLASRYASDYMLRLFSDDSRYQTWRRLWAALARVQHELGLPITEAQAAELEAHITDIDYDIAAQREREVRHDVMAHVYAYGKAAPSAAGIIHLGATSCYVTDNADLILYRDGLVYLRRQLLAVLANLAAFAEKYAATPTLGYTHYQPAQPVTVGKRATLWMQDLLADVEELDHVLSTLKFLGCRGTTGTEASFMDLFDGGEAKIDEMNRRLAASFGFKECFPVCGQTYPRKVDSRILSCLSGIAQSAYRMANDIRLLQHDRQLEEPFEEEQIGSSAMAYKRNPMRCERICSLSRYLMADAMNAPMTASVQWLERTLDDSANRRIALPEGFLCADAVLRLCQNVTAGLRVNEAVVERTLREYLPFSDAHVGPLSQLTLSGARMMTTLAEGVSSAQGGLVSRVSGALAGVGGAIRDWWNGQSLTGGLGNPAGDVVSAVSTPDVPAVGIPPAPSFSAPDEGRSDARDGTGGQIGQTISIYGDIILPNVQNAEDFGESMRRYLQGEISMMDGMA